MGPSTSTHAGPSPHPCLSDPVLRGLPRCVWSPKSSVHLLPTYTIHTTQHLGATSQASGCSHKHTVGSWRTDQGKRSPCLDTGSECLEGNSRVLRTLSVVQKRGCILQVGTLAHGLLTPGRRSEVGQNRASKSGSKAVGSHGAGLLIQFRGSGRPRTRGSLCAET